MAADNINNIISPEVAPEIRLVIDELGRLSQKITDIGNQAIQVKVDLSGAESLTDLTAAIKKMEAAQVSMGNVTKQQTDFIQQNGTANVETAEKILSLQKQIAATEKTWYGFGKTSSAINEQFTKEISGLKEQIAALGGTIGTTSTQIQNQSKVINETTISISALKSKMAEMRLENKQNTDEYAKLEQQLQKVAKAQREVNNSANSEPLQNRQSAKEIREIERAEIAAQKEIDIKLKAQQKILDAEDAAAEKQEQILLKNELNKAEIAQREEEKRIALIEKETERENALNESRVQYAIERQMLQTQAQYREGERRALAMEREIERERIAREKADPTNRVLAQQQTRNDKLAAQQGLAAPGTYDAMSAELSRLKIQIKSTYTEEQLLSGAGKEALDKHNQLESSLRKMDAQMKVNTRNVGNYGSALDGGSKLVSKFGNIVERMGLRMIASVFIFQAGFNAISWLIENFTKLSDSEEIAKNKLDEYNESLTNLNKTLASSEGNISAGIGVDNAKAQEALRITNDTTKSLRERINAYSDLQNLLPNVLKNLTEEEKLNGKFIADNDLIIKAARIKNELAAASANLESATKAVALNRIALTETGKNLDEANDPNNAKNFSLVHYRNADTEARFKQVELLKTQKAAQDAYNKSYSEYNSIKTIDDKKQPHTKSDLNEKLKTIENERKTKDEESKKNYELSAKSFNDEYRLLTDNLEHENEAYVKSKKLLDKYLSDKKISLVDYNEKFSALQKEQATIAAQGAATQDKIDSEIRAERLKQENADVEYINKLEEHAKKLGEINAKLQDEQVRHSIAMKAIGKKGHEYDAQKFAISEKENEVRNDNANISNIKSQLNAANISVGITESTPIEDRSKRQFQESEKDFSERSRLIKELSDLEQKEATDTANVVELQDQLKEQSAQDLFNKKKEQLEKIKDLEIQLAQETLKSIVTIQDNQFAKEQQNLEIKSRMQGIANQQQIEAINATAGFQITKDNQLAKQAAISASQQNAITAEQNNLALKKAKFDKEAAEAGILMNTALAIAKTLPLLADPLTAAYGAVEIGLITAIGAAQYAAAASTPLPQFFMGGITETPIFRAAEMGTELAITPSGEMSLLKNDGVYSAPIGTEIISNDNLMPYLLANLVNPVNYRGSEPTYPKLDDTRIVDAIQDGNMIAARNRPQSQDIAALLEQGRRIERLTNFKNR